MPNDPAGDAERYRAFWEDELAAAELYRGLAAAAPPERRDIFLRLAETEQRHASHWAELIRRDTGRLPPPPRRSLRSRVLVWVARRFGVDAVLPTVIRAETRDRDKYTHVSDAAPGMAAQESAHARALALATVSSKGSAIAMAERRHRTQVGGALRPAVFGVNDGLVSNFSLVMGVAGGTGDARIVLLAGIAGLVAGAGSMAAGEWVSVRAQRELYEQEIEVEQAELKEFPDEEREELELILRAKGLDEQEANRLAERIMEDPDVALDTKVREELGLNPEDLASPGVAMTSSFLAFALGALVPVLPFLFRTGQGALVVSAGLSGLALFVVGAAISVFSSRSALFSGVRMMLIGGIAGALTYGVGSLVGVTLD